ncbi:MAG: class III extradiol ring-cleavage dioxygenase [Leptospirales bacterium]
MNSQRLPVIFIGHGSPMNAVHQNEYTAAWRALGAELKPLVRAVLIVSAHWATRGGLAVTTSKRPGALYDFYGFPETLYQIQYDAPGDPALARRIQEGFAGGGVSGGAGIHVHGDEERALDHGVWSILVHMFPEADVPVVQLSYDMDAGPAEQIAFGRRLVDEQTDFETASKIAGARDGADADEFGYNHASLRDQGVLILTSGNIVHNLREIDFSPSAPPRDWAIEFDRAVKSTLEEGPGNFDRLRDPAGFGDAGRLSVPTLDHYIPFLNFLGMVRDGEGIGFPCEGIQNGSVSMRSVRAG